MLAHAGIDANQARTGDGATPLFAACVKGHTDIVTLLLAHAGIDANQARTDVGATPLLVACVTGHTEIVTLLLAQDGIDANQARTDAITTLGFAGVVYAMAEVAPTETITKQAMILTHGLSAVQVCRALLDAEDSGMDVRPLRYWLAVHVGFCGYFAKNL